MTDNHRHKSGLEWAAHNAATTRRERDELRAEVERLTFLHKQDHALADRYQEHREAAEAEAERLRIENTAVLDHHAHSHLACSTGGNKPCSHQAEIERLKAERDRLATALQAYIERGGEQIAEVERLKAELAQVRLELGRSSTDFTDLLAESARERDELRAQIERLTADCAHFVAEKDALEKRLAMIEASERSQITDLRAEIERLRAENGELGRWWTESQVMAEVRTLRDEVERLRRVAWEHGNRADEAILTAEKHATEVCLLKTDYDAAHTNYVRQRDENERLRTTLDEIQAKVHDGSLSAKQIVGTLRVKLARTAPITPSVASQR